MKKMKNEHPEVEDIKNICDIFPDHKSTKNICDTLKNKTEKKQKKNENLLKK